MAFAFPIEPHISEQSLAADLGLALCLEITHALRDDLRLLGMSATLDTGLVSRFMDDVFGKTRMRWLKKT